MASWYYAQDGQPRGPLAKADLQTMLRAGRLESDTLVWTDGFDGWVAATAVPDLLQATRPEDPGRRSAWPDRPGAAGEPYETGATQRSGFDWYLDAWKQYGVFSGRARRRAFWMFWLFDMVFSFVTMALDGLTENEFGLFRGIYSLATLVPYIAVSVRRMHDTNHSGWWIFVPIVNLVFLCSDSQPGPNRFGPNPKTALTEPGDRG